MPMIASTHSLLPILKGAFGKSEEFCPAKYENLMSRLVDGVAHFDIYYLHKDTSVTVLNGTT